MDPQHLERFATWLQAQNRSPHTVSCYRRDATAILRHLSPKTQPLKVTPDDLAEALIGWQNEKDRARISVCRAVAGLRAFYDWALANHLIPDNPVTHPRS